MFSAAKWQVLGRSDFEEAGSLVVTCAVPSAKKGALSIFITTFS